VHPPSRPAVLVGNDVVDLTAPRAADRHRDERFVARVFTDAERARILADDDPSLRLWLGWAAKEAAYKVVSKALGEPPPFAHRRFAVRWSGPGNGVVRYETEEVQIAVQYAGPDGHVHVLAHMPRATEGPARVDRLDREGAPWLAPLESLLERFTDLERASVHSVPSAAVRIAARDDAARLLDVDVGRLEIVCDPGSRGRRPPRVLVDGTPASVDVSLSHDGPWIAWALAPR
jgi:phosphopantetheine--protein transferase-like protein